MRSIPFLSIAPSFAVASASTRGPAFTPGCGSGFSYVRSFSRGRVPGLAFTRFLVVTLISTFFAECFFFLRAPVLVMALLPALPACWL